LDGGVGVDFCLYQYTSTNYTVRYSDTAKKYYIASKTGAEGTDTFNSIERLTFSNLSLALDIDANAGMVTKVLGSVFGKLAVKNPIFVGIGLSYADKGMTFSDLGSLALNAVGATTNDLIVSTLWKNVVGSDPSISDKTPYIKMLQDGMKPGELVELAANTLLNTTNINLIGLAQTGIEYVPVS
jgi:hypothetical protein